MKSDVTGAPTTRTLRRGVAGADAPPTTRPYLLEQIDDAAVVQLYADGFDKLTLREKTLVYHLYRAAIAGRDIYYDQRHHLNLGGSRARVPRNLGPYGGHIRGRNVCRV